METSTLRFQYGGARTCCEWLECDAGLFLPYPQCQVLQVGLRCLPFNNFLFQGACLRIQAENRLQVKAEMIWIRVGNLEEVDLVYLHGRILIYSRPNRLGHAVIILSPLKVRPVGLTGSLDGCYCSIIEILKVCVQGSHLEDDALNSTLSTLGTILFVSTLL